MNVGEGFTPSRTHNCQLYEMQTKKNIGSIQRKQKIQQIFTGTGGSKTLPYIMIIMFLHRHKKQQRIVSGGCKTLPYTVGFCYFKDRRNN